MTTIYVVETDLPLEKSDRLYDETALNELYQSIRDYLVANPSYDSAEVRPFYPR